MTKRDFEKLPEAEKLKINIDNRDTIDLKNDTAGVVYKPTAMNLNAKKWNQNFQSLTPENPVKTKDSAFLYSTAFTANLLAFSAGLGFSWTSPVLPKLHGPESPLNAPIDSSQESVIAAILCLGAAVGPFIFGYLADKIGRKKTLIVVAFPMAIAMSVLAFTAEVKMYYFARLLYGMGSGGVFTVLTMYIGEITENHNRGKFSCLLGLFVALGVLYPLAIFLIFFTMFSSESPLYLIKIGKVDLAETALIRLREKSKDQVQKELIELRESVENRKNDKGGVGELFRSKGNRRGFMVAAGLLVVQQFSGINAVTGFLEPIFSATGSAVPPQLAATLIGVIQVLTVFATSVLVEKLGRKFLLLSSAIGAGASVIFLGLYFFLHAHQFGVLPYFWWLPVVCLIMYIVTFNLGIGPVPWTVLSEIFPSNVKSVASAMASATCFSTSFVVTLAFPIISEMLGMAQSFWMFGGCCVLGAVFIYYAVPETKGRTLTEIQQALSK